MRSAVAPVPLVSGIVFNGYVSARDRATAMISRHPRDLAPVKPVLQFDLSKYKFVEEMSIVAGLDSRLDLLPIKPAPIPTRPVRSVIPGR